MVLSWGCVTVVICAADPEYLAFVERLNADPQPESKPEAQAATAKGREKPVTALMAFLQEQHTRKRQSAAVAARPRRDRHRESKALPVGSWNLHHGSPAHDWPESLSSTKARENVSVRARDRAQVSLCGTEGQRETAQSAAGGPSFALHEEGLVHAQPGCTGVRRYKCRSSSLSQGPCSFLRSI